MYPHPATVALFRLGRTLKYKDKQGRNVTQLRTELLRLMEDVEGLAQARYRARRRPRDWRQLRSTVETAERKSELRRVEDPVDAVVCAYVAMYATRRPAAVTVYGDVATGYIVTPTLPSDLMPAPPEPTPGAVGDAVARYAAQRPSLSVTTGHYLTVVTGLLDDAGINYLSVTARTQTVASFAAKADRTVDGQRLYTDPLYEMTDQIGLRVITYLRDDVTAVANLLAEEMQILDDRDMGQETAREGRWGYASRHLLVAVEGEQQPASIQVRTVLQHAWAEFEHDIRYKGSIPEEDAPDLDRRFTLAAGLLELADREFSAIRERLRVSLRRRSRVRATGDPRIGTPVLATYLGNRFPDAAGRAPSTTRGSRGCCCELGIDSSTNSTSSRPASTPTRSTRRWTTATRQARCAASTTLCWPRTGTATSSSPATRTGSRCCRPGSSPAADCRVNSLIGRFLFEVCRPIVGMVHCECTRRPQ